MEYRIYNPGKDEQAALEVRSAVWGADHPHTNTRFLEWLIQSPPAGVGSGIIMSDNNKSKNCGFVGISARTVVYDDRELRVAHCLDFMVNPHCRAAIAALRLANKCVQTVREQQYDFTFAFPNNNSFGLVTSPKCGYKTIFSPMLLVRPLPNMSLFRQRGAFLPAALRKFLPGVLAKLCSIRASYTLRSMPAGEALQFDRFGAAFDRLWQRARSIITVAIKRDAAYLNWRFSQNPIYRYRKTSWSNNSDTKGYIVGCDREISNMPCTLIVDFLADPEDRQVLPALINEEVKQANGQGSHLIATQAIYGSDIYNAFISMGFIPVPQKLNPKQFNFTVHNLEHDLPLLADPKLWFFSWSDMDVV